jgi:hypothetical protein
LPLPAPDGKEASDGNAGDDDEDAGKDDEGCSLRGKTEEERTYGGADETKTCMRGRKVVGIEKGTGQTEKGARGRRRWRSWKR